MEAIITRIKEYVLVIYPNILTDLSLSNDQLDFIVRSVVDRALAHTRRDQLVAKYEEDLLDDNVDEEDYVLPIPREVERALASTVVSSMQTLKQSNADIVTQTGAISSISDNGQSISYAGQAMSFFTSSDDATVFSGTLGVLNRYILPTSPRNGYNRRFQTGYWR